MNALADDPVIPFAQNADKASRRLKKSRNDVWVGRADLSGAEHLDADPEIYDGMRVSSHGVMRVAYDHKNKSFLLLAAKAPDILQGKRNEQGEIYATQDSIERCYIVSAYRSPLAEGEPFKMPEEIADQMREDWFLYTRELSQRNQKHFTLYHASVSDLPEELRDELNVDTDTEILTNGRFFYTLDKDKGDGFNVRFYAPTRRKDGSFVAVPLKGRNFLSEFNKVSKSLCANVPYVQARHKIAEHWEEVSSRLWDERKDFDDSVFLKSKNIGANVLNFPRDKKGALLRAASVGTVSWMLGDATRAAAASVATFTAEHFLLDEGAREAEKYYGKALKVWWKGAVANCDFGENVADFYKIRERSHMLRLCAKINPELCNASDIQFLTLEQNNMRLAHEDPEDGMRPLDIRGLIISMGQRGFSSIASFPDQNTQVSAYQNGLMVLENKLPGQPAVYYAWYRDDISLTEGRGLPKHYKDQIGSGIMRIEYDPHNGPFTQSFNDISFDLSVDDMMQDLKSRLFKTQSGVAESVQKQSLEFVRESFSKPNYSCFDYMEETNSEKIWVQRKDVVENLWGGIWTMTGEEPPEKIYMGGQFTVPPDASALNYQKS